MSKNARRIAICLLTAIVLTIIILLIPDFVEKSIPTATPVKVSKVSYTRSVTTAGNIVKNEETGDICVQTFIPEKDISEIRTGLPATITGTAFPDRTYEAEVIGIASSASKITVGNATKTVVEVWAQILDPDEVLKSGYTADITIITGTPENMRLIPYDAVNQDEVGEFIYVLKNGTAVKRYIKIGSELPDGVEVIAGLLENEEVIKASDVISDGDEVKIISPEDSNG
ncbi:MAG: efflux RND transporter periplasmic adaptor subunit [Ruminococcus sp.]|jgi:multidrug efflux pump subunit AcrA (membrane-fusion protein)|nr:efflux RND transporter periplasmic adaptor subunit [Ruminococcus sp.]